MRILDYLKNIYFDKASYRAGALCPLCDKFAFSSGALRLATNYDSYIFIPIVTLFNYLPIGKILMCEQTHRKKLSLTTNLL